MRAILPSCLKAAAQDPTRITTEIQVSLKMRCGKEGSMSRTDGYEPDPKETLFRPYPECSLKRRIALCIHIE